MLDIRAVALHLSRMGFSINVEKSAFVPLQTAVYLGIRLDMLSMMVRLSDDRIKAALSLACSIASCPRVSVVTFQRLLGLMASATSVVPLGLLYARPLQQWFARLHLDPV